EAQGFNQLQPDGRGEDDRVDPRPAADEPARPVGHAAARLLPGPAGPHAVHRGAEQGAAGRDESPAEPVEGAGAVLGEEVAANGLRRGGRGGRGHAEPHPVAFGARLRHTLPRAFHRQGFGTCLLSLTEKTGAPGQPRGTGMRANTAENGTGLTAEARKPTCE